MYDLSCDTRCLALSTQNLKSMTCTVLMFGRRDRRQRRIRIRQVNNTQGKKVLFYVSVTANF